MQNIITIFESMKRAYNSVVAGGKKTTYLYLYSI